LSPDIEVQNLCRKPNMLALAARLLRRSTVAGTGHATRGLAVREKELDSNRRRRTMPRNRSGRRRYSEKASRKVERAMHERKRGTLRSGRSGKRVTSRKQAIAIGLSEARRAGGKVPSQKSSSRRSRKSSRRK